MKYLLEFARFSDVTISKDNRINSIINQTFNDDERLIVAVPFKNNKDILLNWYNTTTHKIIERIKKRTSFRSTSEFNSFIKKAIYDLFDNHFNEMGSTGKYALLMKEKNFYIIFSIDSNFIFSKAPYTIIKIFSISTSTPNEVIKTIVINDEDF